MKNLIRPVLTVIFIVLGIALSGAAMAWGGHGGGHWRGHGGGHWHGHTSLGIYFGAPFYGPRYYPAYGLRYYPAPYYYPPVYHAPVIVAPSPPVYIERGDAAPAPEAESAQQNWWYYCTDSKTYYPYVKECPGGWQRVAPQPPAG